MINQAEYFSYKYMPKSFIEGVCICLFKSFKNLYSVYKFKNEFVSAVRFIKY